MTAALATVPGILDARGYIDAGRERERRRRPRAEPPPRLRPLPRLPELRGSHRGRRDRRHARAARRGARRPVDADAAPFLLWVHYIDPHFPYAPPASWQRPARGAGLSRPGGASRRRPGGDRARAHRPRRCRRARRSPTARRSTTPRSRSPTFDSADCSRRSRRAACSTHLRRRHLRSRREPRRGRPLLRARAERERRQPAGAAPDRRARYRAAASTARWRGSRTWRPHCSAWPVCRPRSGRPSTAWISRRACCVRGAAEGAPTSRSPRAVARCCPRPSLYLASRSSRRAPVHQRRRFSLCVDPGGEPRLYDHVADPFLRGAT